MARTVYHVVFHQGAWKIKIGNEDNHHGPYTTQAAATRMAIDTAHTNGQKNNPDTQVVVHGLDGRIKTEYTYGNDPYPPKG